MAMFVKVIHFRNLHQSTACVIDIWS